MIKLTNLKSLEQNQAKAVVGDPSFTGVDGAFLREVRDDQRHLRQLTLAIENSLSGGELHLNPSLMAELFARLRDQLAWHFSLEESMGYLGEFVSAAPRLCRKAERLQSQHEVLYHEICLIAEEAQALCRQSQTPPDARLRILEQKYADFRIRLQDHNSEEDDLMVEVLYFDIGGGD